MRPRLSISQSGVNAVEVLTYIDFLICKDEMDQGYSYSEDEYKKQFFIYVEKLANPQQ